MSDLLIIVLSLVGVAGCWLAWYEVERVDKRYWFAAPVTVMIYGALIMSGLLIIIVRLLILPTVKARKIGKG